MTLTETSQAFIEKNEELRIQELIAASQKFLSQTSQPPTPTVSTTTTFNFHPEAVGQEKQQLRSRKSKSKINSEKNFEDIPDMSLPISRNSSTPSLTNITNNHTPPHIHVSNSSMVNINSGPNSASIVTPTNHNQSGGNNSPNSTKNDNKKSHHREKSEPEIPTGPPELIRDPTSDSFSSHAYSWPILFAVVPPMGALIYGKSDIWSDFLLLLLIAFYLYNIIKVPWELYYAARSRRVLNDQIPGQNVDLVQDERRIRAATELRRQETYALLFVIGSPILGGYALHGAKMYLTDYDKYISHFNIVLFVFAAGIRPLMHITSLAKNRTLHLQEQVHYPSTEVELLKRRVQHLEYELSQLRRGFATKRDVISVRDGFEPTISQLNRAVRRYEKKEQYLRNYSDERFAYLESKMREFDNFISCKLHEEQAPRGMFQVMINIGFSLFGYAKYILPGALRGPRPTPMLKPASNSDEGNQLNDDMTNDREISDGSLQIYH
ncbi:hypothetical protein Glove_564g57 [Diversispora epigaea]|uniref:Uncharacterized protein n=1 Tax=Diversispora epigaea TaxID=1348612 RepID=A0A397GDL3_9GLOM|nr:hypothetical protein Glove_564g57 [Diversispora epigaea]